jgi:stringent starvation protein B
MSSSVPYLLNALYEWMLDNECTPYLIVDASVKDVSVPQQFVKDNQIILNVSPIAVRNLRIEKEFVDFGGRFSGVPHEIHVPIEAVLGIVTKENSEGMWFPRPDGGTDTPDPGGKPGVKKGPPKLTIVD